MTTLKVVGKVQLISRKLKILRSYCPFFSYFIIITVDSPNFVPDGDVPKGEEKINLKNLYEMLRDTYSHGLVFLQFLGVFGTVFLVLE